MRTRTTMIVLALLMATGAVAAGAGVRRHEINGGSLIFVENDPWEPEEFIKPLVLRAAFVEHGPTIDGRADDAVWTRAASLTVPLAYGAVREVTLKAVYTAKEIFLLVSWPDPTKDDQHHPWVWNPSVGRYEEGPEVEDALLVSIEGGCEWTPSLLSGHVFDFDGWLWMAARSDPIGQAVDIDGSVRERSLAGSVKYRSRNTKPFWNVKFIDPRSDILTRPWQELSRSYKRAAPLEEVWVRYPPDRSLSPAFAERLAPPAAPPIQKTSTVGPRATASVTAPQYRPLKLQGDAGEVAAKGRWVDGRWTVEFRRALATPSGTVTDSVFNRVTQFSIHVFDHTERVDEASESGRLYLQFEPANSAAATKTDGSPAKTR